MRTRPPVKLARLAGTALLVAAAAPLAAQEQPEFAKRACAAQAEAGVRDSTPIYPTEQLDSAAVYDRRTPLPGLRGPGQQLGIAFVIDTMGRVDLCSVRVLKESHPGLAERSRRELERLRFAPARFDGHRVRELMHLWITSSGGR